MSRTVVSLRKYRNSGRFPFTKRFRKIPETSLGNAYRRKTCSIWHTRPIHPRLPSPSDVFPAKIQNGGTTVIVERMLDFSWKMRVSLIQMMMTFLSWRPLQPIWGAIFPEIKVFMKIFCLHRSLRSMKLKPTSGWLEGPLKLCAGKYKPQEEFLSS